MSAGYCCYRPFVQFRPIGRTLRCSDAQRPFQLKPEDRVSHTAKKTLSKYFFDVSGDEIGDDSPTVSFALEGTSYEIDLTESEKQELRDALAPYVGVARKSGRGPTRKRTTGGPAPKDVRDWARENNIDVPARGRIPASVIEAFEHAH